MSSLSLIVKAVYTFIMIMASIGKLINNNGTGNYDDWTNFLNYTKWFQYAVGIVELLMALLSGYNLFIGTNQMVNIVSIFLGFVLIGGTLYTFLIRARIKTLERRLACCIIALLLTCMLAIWIVMDNLKVPIFTYTGIIIGFLGGFAVPKGYIKPE